MSRAQRLIDMYLLEQGSVGDTSEMITGVLDVATRFDTMLQDLSEKLDDGSAKAELATCINSIKDIQMSLEKVRDSATSQTVDQNLAPDAQELVGKGLL